MKLQSKYADLVLNLLVAVAISLVVNFSYVLLLVVQKSDDRHPPFSRELRTDREIVRVEGDVWFTRTATASTCPRGACGGWRSRPATGSSRT